MLILENNPSYGCSIGAYKTSISKCQPPLSSLAVLTLSLSLSLRMSTGAWSSTIFSISSVKSKSINTHSHSHSHSLASFKFRTSFPRPSSSSSPSVSRKSCRVLATILKEDDEKVIVEDSFPPEKTFPVNEEPETENSSSNLLDNWLIKFEQSINVLLTDSVIKILDTFYHDRHYARFFVLETIARVPYFAFLSVLHLYETFGWWRRADYLKVHFAESWNEMHHLLIMEELGGNDWWLDRFLAQHMAVAYYFMTVVMYMISPRMAYHFSECVESHAFSTYDKFIKAQGEELKELPAPEVAVKYYTEGDMYLFDEFQTSRAPKSRRPKIENLYDVFVNVRDDEAEHCKTMRACQSPGILRSPHSYLESSLEDDEPLSDLPEADCEGILDCIKKSVTSSPAGNEKL